MYILSQVSAFLAFCCVIAAFQSRKKAMLHFWVTMGNLFLVLSYALMSLWMPVAILSIATVRSFVYLLLEKYRGKYPKWISLASLIFFLTACVVATLFTWDMWFEFVLLGGIMLYTLGGWLKGEHFVRIAGIQVSIIAIIYNILIANWTAIAVDVATLTSIIIYYYRKWHKKKNISFDTNTIAHTQ